MADLSQAPPQYLLTCTNCRKSHLRCDAALPVCGRCQQMDRECSWTKSRRGQRGKPDKPSADAIDPNQLWTSGALQARANDLTWFDQDIRTGNDELVTNDREEAFQAGWDSILDFADVTDAQLDFGSSKSMASLRPTPRTPSLEFLSKPNSGYQSGEAAGLTVNRRQVGPAESSTPLVVGQDWSFLIDTYYYFFHNAHPILIPQSCYSSGTIVLPTYLKAVLAFTASNYIASDMQNALYGIASEVTSVVTPDEGFKVQALLVWATVMWSRMDKELAISALEMAVSIALQLNMHEESFAKLNNMNSLVVEESWRRTWWDLYIMDGIMAMLTENDYKQRLLDIESNVPLPCEEDVYSAGGPFPLSRTFSDFQNRQFADEDYRYSSFTYKIESIRLLRPLITSRNQEILRGCEATGIYDASLANYLLSLPQSKRNIAESDGRVDEMIRSAHDLINCAMIFLHRPVSDLVVIPQSNSETCGHDQPVRVPASSYSVHTSKAVRAANTITSLTTVSTSLNFHCPSFACAVAIGASVHLSIYALEARKEQLIFIKERLHLAISALTLMGEVWPVAEALKSEIAGVAKEVFKAKNHGDP